MTSDQPKTEMGFTLYVAFVLLDRNRDPGALLKQQGVRREHAARLADYARREAPDAILYSITPGRARMLVACETRHSMYWYAQLVDLDHLYRSSEEACAAANRSYQELKRKSRKVYGWGAHCSSLVEAVTRGAHYLCNGGFSPRSDAIISTIVTPPDTTSEPIRRWINNDDSEPTSLH